MNKMDTLIFKLKDDIVFPHQKVNVSMGNYTRKLKYNDYLGLSYKDKNNSHREIGVLAKVIGIVNNTSYTNDSTQPISYSYVTLEILSRIKIQKENKSKDENNSELFVSTVEILEDEIITQEIKEKISQENLFEQLKTECKKYFLYNNINIDIRYEFNYVKYVYMICPYLYLNGEDKQKILEMNDLYQRMKEVMRILIEKSKMNNKNDDSSQLAKINSKENNKENNKEKDISPLIERILNNVGRQNKRISSKQTTIDNLENKINSIKMPEEAKAIAIEELDKLKSNPQIGNNPEHEWIINYLNTFVKLPWDKTTQDNEDISKTKEILERDHFGLHKVKKRIIEHLSVRKLNNNSKRGSILCFNGPPGVGKTSLAKSIAESLGKNFYRLSLGGVRDESEIRGHRRTYIAAMPGMIIQALIRANSKNPVILLDEIDKVGTHIKGDVSNSLLEVLDPEQNSSFKDNYINTTFDLSEVIFICTSNYLENVSPPLRDRLEVIDIPGYTIGEKIQICRRYLISKQIKDKGLNNTEFRNININFSDDILESMIVDYTFESGVRQLERNVASVCRYVARKVVEELEKSNDNINNIIKLKEFNFNVNEEILREILGRKMSDINIDLRTSNPGVAIGLAYTLNGGALILIETTKFKGKGEVIITGNMGDIMKESVSTGISWIKTNTHFLGLEEFDFDRMSLHIHVPQAAVPKDGPSAGVTITISIISLLKSTLIRKDTAMTGEITLQGFVLPVGGIKEKCLAAVRNKIKRIILPYDNLQDMEELPEETKKSLEFIFVKDIKEVIQNSFYGNVIEEGKFDIKPIAKF